MTAFQNTDEKGALSVTIRTELPADFPAINEIVKSAFQDEGKSVAQLVDNIRSSENYVPELTLVAEDENKRVLGHVMLSYVELEENDQRHRILSLSPLSVSPEAQGMGIGSKLVEAVADLADKQGEPLIVLEGSPKYYPRFGFKHSVPYGISIDLPDWASPEASMVLPLSHYDPHIRGKVIYPPAFDSVVEK